MDRFIILSGCSGGGKSTLLAELARRGFATVEEPGRRIVFYLARMFVRAQGRMKLRAIEPQGLRVALQIGRREGIGMRNLESALRDEFGLGDEIEGWSRIVASTRGMANFSDDGFVMAGRGLNPSGASQVWYADLRALAEWSAPGGGHWRRRS